MTIESPPPLFRKEVQQGQGDRLHGDVNLAIPISWQTIGYTLLFLLASVLLFLATASYSRVTVTNGEIVLDRGIAPVFPSRSGTISDLMAREGERVLAGTPLVRIRATHSLMGGGTLTDRRLKALEQQERSAEAQRDYSLVGAQAEERRLAAVARGLDQEVSGLDRQLAVQREFVASARRHLDVVRSVAERGFISGRDLIASEEELMIRQQGLAQLEQQRASKLASLNETRRAIEEARAGASAQAASLSSARASLSERRAEAEAQGGYVVTSPVDGIVTALTARPGQTANADRPLLVVVPDDAVPQVELYIPNSAIAFLQPGQEVRLAVDAFPYQTFGTVEGRILRLSSVAVLRPASDGDPEPVYLATAELPQPWVNAFGRRQRLLPGMAVTARILTRRQSLLEWLFEPLFAVARR